jgi:transposase
MRGRAFSREFKLEVVQQIASGAKRPAQVCREHHVAETVLLRWRREYEERGAAAFTPRDAASGPLPAEQRVAELERFCGQLALENAALKKALQHLQAHQAAASKNGTQ